MGRLPGGYAQGLCGVCPWLVPLGKGRQRVHTTGPPSAAVPVRTRAPGLAVGLRGQLANYQLAQSHVHGVGSSPKEKRLAEASQSSGGQLHRPASSLATPGLGRKHNSSRPRLRVQPCRIIDSFPAHYMSPSLIFFFITPKQNLFVKH